MAIFQVDQYQNVSVTDFIGAKCDGSGGDNCSYKTCKAPVRLSPINNQYPAFYTLALPIAQPAVSKHLKGIFT